MSLRKNTGFTLIEVIVVAGIIAILAGILVPIIFKELDESRVTRASADMRSIQTALMVFRKDTGRWPTVTDDCSTQVTLLEGSGDMPENNLAAVGYDTSVRKTFNEYLRTDIGCFSNWKGPYMADVTPDPWGKKYLMNALQLDEKGMVWIISPGPNGLLETPSSSSTLVGDDIGILFQYGNAAS